MITTFAFFERKRGLGQEEFIRHWRDVHGPLIANIDYLRGYTQDHPAGFALPTGLDEPWFHGIAQFWWDDREAAARPATDPVFTEHGRLDEPNFLHPPSLAGLESQPYKLHGTARTPADGSTKLMVFLTRAPHVGEESFQGSIARYWERAAVEAGADRALLHLAFSDAPHEFDAVVELWWTVRPAYEAWRDSRAAGVVAGIPDLDPGRSTMFAASEHTVVPMEY